MKNFQIKTFRKVTEKRYNCFNTTTGDLLNWEDVPTDCIFVSSTSFELKDVGTGYNDTRCEWTEQFYSYGS